MEALASFLQRVVPRIKTFIQLSGLALGAVIFYLAYISNPPNLPAQVTGGLIAVSVLVFTLSLNVLTQLPKQSRAKFILILFSVFVVASTIFLALSIIFLLKSGNIANAATANELAASLRNERSQVLQQLDARIGDKTRLDQQISRSSGGPFAQIEEYRTERQTVLEDINHKRTRLMRLDALLDDLTRPNPKIIDAIRDAERELGRAPSSEDISRYNKATAAILKGDMEPLKELIEKKQIVSEGEFVKNTLDRGWLSQVDGDYKTARQYYEKALAVAPRWPRVLEAMADIYMFDGDQTAALRTWDELVKIREAERPQNITSIALAYKDRATASWRSGDYDGARDHYIKAQDAFERSPNKEQVVLANLCNERAWYQTLLGNFERAAEDYETANAYFSSPGSSDYGRPHFLNNYGVFLLNEFKVADAIQYFKYSIEAQGKTIGLGTELNGTTFWNWAEAESTRGNYGPSDELFARSKVIYDRIGLKNATLTDRMLIYRSFTQAMAGRSANFQTNSLESIHRLKEKIGETHPAVVQTAIHFSQVSRAAGNVDSALELLGEIIAKSRLPPYLAWQLNIEWIIANMLSRSPNRIGKDQLLAADTDATRTRRVDTVSLFFARALIAKERSQLAEMRASFCAADRILSKELEHHDRLAKEFNTIKQLTGVSLNCF